MGVVQLSKVRCQQMTFVLQPEPFYLIFALYDAKEGRKISEDFHMDLNDPEIENMIPADVMFASDRLNKVEGKSGAPDLNGIQEAWLTSKQKQVSSLPISKGLRFFLSFQILSVLKKTFIY